MQLILGFEGHESHGNERFSLNARISRSWLDIECRRQFDTELGQERGDDAGSGRIWFWSWPNMNPDRNCCAEDLSSGLQEQGAKAIYFHPYGPMLTMGVIFDGDDTLWDSEQLYDDARSRARALVEKAGLDGAMWEERERIIDVHNFAKLGYSTNRFPVSCVEAYRELCLSRGLAVNNGVAKQIRNVARSVFKRDAPLVLGVRETLGFLRSHGARLALLTKGDPELQRRRIRRSGLRDLFHVIRIVAEKSPAVILEVVTALGVDPHSTWMVGNSMRSDVLPAIAAGLRAIRIPAHVWEHERSHDHLSPEGAVTTTKLADVCSLIIG